MRVYITGDDGRFRIHLTKVDVVKADGQVRLTFDAGTTVVEVMMMAGESLDLGGQLMQVAAIKGVG